LPIYALDPKRKILYGNEALAKWLSVRIEDLLGVRCDYHAGLDAETFSLGAPPSVFEDCVASGCVSRRNADLGDEIREATFLPLRNENGQLSGVFAVVGSPVVALSENPESRTDAGAAVLHQQILQFREQYRRDFALERLIGHSPAIQLVRDRVALAVQSPTRVIVVGPRGSGRERVARTIHYQTKNDRLPPIVPLDCELLDAELLETTVTAFLRRCGELEIEGVPCLLLLEVDRLSADAQDVLHNFLSVKEFELRTLSTARESLSELANASSFRDDLATMLSTLTIRLPSLNERLEDIPLLLQHAIEQLNAAGGHQMEGFSEQATRQLLQYPWPGNVDELLSIVRQIHASAQKAVVDVGDLPKQIRLGIDADQFPIVPVETIQLDEFLGKVERELVQRAMRQASGNKAQAARLLGIPRARLIRRLDHLGIE
jgi:DNA-binding NtrC family response regulator